MILSALFLIVGTFCAMTPTRGSLLGSIVRVGVPLLILVITGMFARIDVRVLDDHGQRALDISYGAGVLHQRFLACDILGAKATHCTLTQLGGWGYRGSLHLFSYAALATRRGEALELTLPRGRRFVVTIDTPQAFVDALGRPLLGAH